MLLGSCGVGKTHLAIALALKALENGHQVYFLTLHDLIIKIRLAREKNRLHVLLATIMRTQLVVLDELGFLPLTQEDATFLFELVNKRYLAHKSTITTPGRLVTRNSGSGKREGIWDNRWSGLEQPQSKDHVQLTLA